MQEISGTRKNPRYNKEEEENKKTIKIYNQYQREKSERICRGDGKEVAAGSI